MTDPAELGPLKALKRVFSDSRNSSSVPLALQNNLLYPIAMLVIVATTTPFSFLYIILLNQSQIVRAEEGVCRIYQRNSELTPNNLLAELPCHVIEKINTMAIIGAVTFFVAIIVLLALKGIESSNVSAANTIQGRTETRGRHPLAAKMILYVLVVYLCVSFITLQIIYIV